MGPYNDIRYQYIKELIRLDPEELNYHADRYDSAMLFRALIVACRDGRVLPNDLDGWIFSIGKLGGRDGADEGTIPLLGGEHQRVWAMLREDYKED